MTQDSRREILIQALLDEQPAYAHIPMPTDENEQWKLLRSLMNVRRAAPMSRDFQLMQDEYLQELNHSRGIIALSELEAIQPEIYLWQGDITRLRCGAIVNAANSGMTGCYQPCHSCIDNCIHTYAGIELRNYCADIMDKQGYEEPTGQAKLTPAFNLPCDYVIHTVGPIVQGRLTHKHCEQLESCYRCCLKIAEENNIGSIAFCCISTGVFMFPNREAAEIAVAAVKDFKRETGSHIKVIFNVFKDLDLEIYREFLS